MRRLTLREEELAESVVKVVMPRLLYRRADQTNLAVLCAELRSECHKRHAMDPTFPPDWAWEARVIWRRDNRGDLHPTGNIMARPICIDGEDIDRWELDEVVSK